MEAIFNRTNEDVSSWKAEMHTYEKGKRTKKPFGKTLPNIERVTSEQIKTRQTLFNPVLQTFKFAMDESRRADKDEAGRVKSLMNHFKNTAKYDKSYDIVNLYGSEAGDALPQVNKKLGPVRNIYNVINNQKLADCHYKSRQLRLPVEREMVVLAKPPREFDLVSGNYKQNHAERADQELKDKDNQIIDKYWKTRDFDPIFGKFYDQGKEEVFQEGLKEKGKEHGKDFDNRLPPSYICRETYISDFSKPLPENLKTLDEQRQNAKKRYRTKYVVEGEYAKRNEDWDQKADAIIHNRVHNGRVIEEKAKTFDIVANTNYREDRAEKLYGKQTIVSTWEKLNKAVSSAAQPTTKIKSSGFGEQI